MKKVFVWDFADTLFIEKWDKNLSGVNSYRKYLKKIGFSLNTITGLEYELQYEGVFKNEFLKVSLNKGFRDVLGNCENNFGFTSGNLEQIKWRSAQLEKQGEKDVAKYFNKTISTFDYSNLNKKTLEVFIGVLKDLSKEWEQVVYIDNELNNCINFLNASRKYPNLQNTCYHILNNSGGIRKKDRYCEIGSLFDILKVNKLIR